MSLDKLRDLEARLAAATGADRDADRAICLWQRPRATLWTPGWWSGGPNEYWREPDDEKGAHYDMIARYTSSLDAAVALCERVLPGWRWNVSTNANGTAFAYVFRVNKELEPGHQHEDRRANAPTPALALCLAIIRAHLAQAEGARERQQSRAPARSSQSWRLRDERSGGEAAGKRSGSRRHGRRDAHCVY